MRLTKNHMLRILLAVLILLLVVTNFGSLQRLLVLTLFFIINIITAVVKRFVPTLKLRKYTFGFETVLFCTVLTSVSFGPKIGMLMGAALMAINYIAERRLSRYFMVTLLLYAIIGYAAYFFRATDIVLLGIIITLVYNIVVFLMVLPLGANPKTMLVFSAVNISTNIAFFALYGPTVFRILAS